MMIGGLMGHAFKILLGNPDVIVTVITWMVFSTLLLSIIELNKSTEN